MRRRGLVVILLAVGGLVLLGTTAATSSLGDGRTVFTAELNGYNEVVGGPGPGTGSVSTGARGTFIATLVGDELQFTLTYSGMEGGTVTQAHPHFAQQHVGGDIFGFFCGGPKAACPTPGGTVTGTFKASDVIGPAGQGVPAGAFDELVAAMRAGAVYVNVHSQSFPEGEIRGQIRGGITRGFGFGD